MDWNPTWPFKSREQALAHERAYLAGSHSIPGHCHIRLVDECDLQIERWLESDGAARLRKDPSDMEVIRKIYHWKMSAIKGSVYFPESIQSGRKEFAAALNFVLQAKGDKEMACAINALKEFKDVKIRVASAFIYWLRPDEYQVIDRRVTKALNLSFIADDYTCDNYLRYCGLSRDLSAQHNLSLRQIDRALFVFQKLSESNSNISDPIH